MGLTTRLSKIAWRLVPVAVLAVSGVLVSAVSVQAAPLPLGKQAYGNWRPGPTYGNSFPSQTSGNWPPGLPYDCAGGNIPPGTYSSMVISGVCYMPAGNISILGNLTVSNGALLDAVTPDDPASSPLVAATVSIGGNVFVGRDGVLLLGCSPNELGICPEGINYDRVGGNLTAIGALGVVVHSATIGGSATLFGGGGGAAAENCSAVTVPPSAPVPPAPWSEDASMDNTPVYSDFEDSTIGGNLAIISLTSCWLGSLRDQVGGSATIIGNTMGDPDAMEINTNLVGGNMVCFHNTPGTPPAPTPPSIGVQFGDSGGAPNIVGGLGVGECGFDVRQPNPAPEALLPPPEFAGEPSSPPAIQEPIAVSARSLGTYLGRQQQIGSAVVGPITFGVTESGDKILGAVTNDVLKGSGLTGSITYSSSFSLGNSGEAVLSTTHPDGSSSFTAYITCDCNFDGQSGNVTIRAYGTTTSYGATSGTFLITSGGPFVVGPLPTVVLTGGLGTLAGYGTFFSWGGVLGLVEHLGLT